MSIANDHSENLPSEFFLCPNCGKKGVYAYGDSYACTGDYLIRCRYCKVSSYGYYTESIEKAITKRLSNLPVQSKF